MREAEKELHKYFADRRMYGEWFNINESEIEDFYDVYNVSDLYTIGLLDMRAYVSSQINSVVNPFATILMGDKNYYINELYKMVHSIQKWAKDFGYCVKVNGEIVLQW